MMTRSRMTLAVLVAAMVFSHLKAEGTYYMSLGLLPVRYMEFPSPDADVRVMRLNLTAGCHRSMYGLDLGTIGNWTSENMGGVIIAGGYNVAQHECYGLQLSCVNFTGDAHYGLQTGICNLTWGIRGFQLGLVNVTSDGAGLQIGVYNVAEDFSGFQLGLINMNMASPLMMMPFVNIWF